MRLYKQRGESNITFIIFTYNEERRIEYPVKCFVPYGKVLVVDNGSTDNTRGICKSLGAKILLYKRKKGFIEQQEHSDYIYQYVDTDWVFWGFADEMIPRTCLELYQKIVREDKYKVVVQKRKTLIFDAESEFYPHPVAIKFFRKDSIDFTDNKIHQSGKFAPHVKPSEVLYLPPIDEYSVYHFSISTAETQLKVIRNYATEHAESFDEQITWFYMVRSLLLNFILNYFIHGSWKYGVKGLIASMHSVFYLFMVMSYAYDLENNITVDSMEREFVKGKKRLLVDLPKTNFLQKIFARIKIVPIAWMHKRYKFKQSVH